MGSSGSKFLKRTVGSFTGTGDQNSTDDTSHSIIKSASPFVLTRTSSMYFDEDGDLAHEFYIEVPSSRKGCKASMKRILHNLTPEGEVRHLFPRLQVDVPVILYQGELLKNYMK